MGKSGSDPDDRKPLLPLHFGPKSNGEYFHPPSETDRLIEKVALERAEINAKRVGMDRRSFLATSAGLATTLSAINLVTGCGGNGDSGDAGPDAIEMVDCDLDGARELLDPSSMFLMDVQTHHIDEASEYVEDWQTTNIAYATAFNIFFNGSCPEATSHIPCLGRDDYTDLIFRQSDVSVAVLSTFPALTCDQADRIGYPVQSGICGDFLPTEAIAETRNIINDLAGSKRVIGHAAVLPNPSSHLSAADKDWWMQEVMRGMENAVTNFGLRAWKCYTPFGPLPHELIKDKPNNQLLGSLLDGSIIAEGWLLDDEAGIAMIEQARNLDAKLINVHKGVPLLSFNPAYGTASDVGRVATRYPDVTFVVYHSALNFNGPSSEGVEEGPYVPEDWKTNDDPHGINSLIHSVVINGLSAEGKGSDYIGNVVAELGGPGGRAISRPEQGTHIFGKLLKYVGENNIVWGTDAIWGGSPQALIQGFLAFQMDEKISDAYGYPPLTDEIKAKILGLNAARIYGVDVDAKRCELANDGLASVRRDYKDMMWRKPEPVRLSQLYKGPRSRREFLKLWEKNPNWPG